MIFIDRKELKKIVDNFLSKCEVERKSIFNVINMEKVNKRLKNKARNAKRRISKQGLSIYFYVFNDNMCNFDVFSKDFYFDKKKLK